MMVRNDLIFLAKDLKQKIPLSGIFSISQKSIFTSILKPLSYSLPNQLEAGSKRREEEPGQLK